MKDNDYGEARTDEDGYDTEEGEPDDDEGSVEEPPSAMSRSMERQKLLELMALEYDDEEDDEDGEVGRRSSAVTEPTSNKSRSQKNDGESGGGGKRFGKCKLELNKKTIIAGIVILLLVIGGIVTGVLLALKKPTVEPTPEPTPAPTNATNTTNTTAMPSSAPTTKPEPGDVADVFSNDFAKPLKGVSVSLSTSGDKFAFAGLIVDDTGDAVTQEIRRELFEWTGQEWSQKTLEDVEPFSNSPGMQHPFVALSGDASIIAIREVGGVVLKNTAGEMSPVGSKIEFDGEQMALSEDGQFIAIGNSNHEDTTNGIESGLVRVFRYAENSWKKIGDDIVGTEKGSFAGSSLSLINGPILAVGSTGENTDKGAVRLYEFDDDTTWNERQEIRGAKEGDLTGTSVSLSADGTRVAIGAIGHEQNKGKCIVFGEDQWATKVGSDIEGDATDVEFGHAVSLSGDGNRLAVASPKANSNQGLVRIYDFSSTEKEWTQVKVLEGTAVGEHFGSTVVLSSDGKRIAVGAKGLPGGPNGKVQIVDVNSER